MSILNDDHWCWHAAPLHYLPHILVDHALYAQSVLAPRGIRPRATAARRDRMLGLADYIHLSTSPHTPLLAQKMARGYAHVLLPFPRDAVLSLPGVALLPYNTKAWRAKAAYVPVTDPDQQRDLLNDHRRKTRCPSLEILVKYGLGLETLAQVAFVCEAEREAASALLGALNLPPPAPLCVTPELFPLRGAYCPTTQEPIFAYFDACREAGAILPPPEIAFD